MTNNNAGPVPLRTDEVSRVVSSRFEGAGPDFTSSQVAAKDWAAREIMLLKASRAKGKVSIPHQKEGLSRRRSFIPISRAEGIIFTRSPYVGSFKRDKKMERMNPRANLATRQELGIKSKDIDGLGRGNEAAESLALVKACPTGHSTSRTTGSHADHLARIDVCGKSEIHQSANHLGKNGSTGLPPALRPVR